MKVKCLKPILENRTRNQNRRRKSALAVPTWLAVLLAAGTVRAGTLWWDGGTTDIGGSGDGVSAGDNGIWNATIMNWDQGAGLPHVACGNTTTDTAVFGGSGGTVTLETDITLGGLQFAEGTSSTTVSGGTLNFGPGGAITNLVNVSLTCNTSGSSILFTTDGSDPLTNPNGTAIWYEGSFKSLLRQRLERLAL